MVRFIQRTLAVVLAVAWLLPACVGIIDMLAMFFIDRTIVIAWSEGKFVFTVLWSAAGFFTAGMLAVLLWESP